MVPTLPNNNVLMFQVGLNVSETGRCHSHLAFSEKGNWESPYETRDLHQSGLLHKKQAHGKVWIDGESCGPGDFSGWGRVCKIPGHEDQMVELCMCKRNSKKRYSHGYWEAAESQGDWELWFWTKAISSVEGRPKERWHREQNTAERTVLYSCSVNKLNYLENIPLSLS